MKYLLKSIVIVFMLMFIFTSCQDSILDKTPPDALQREGFFNSADRAIMGINAAYATLQDGDLYRVTYAKLVEAPSDDVVLSNTTGTEFNSWAFPSSNEIILSVYGRLYEGVGRANLVIEQVPNIQMDEDLKNTIVGEAKFLRALYYWHLTTLWGEVPLFMEPIEDPNDALIAKSSVSAIHDLIIQDLLDAEMVLPVSYDNANLGRATKGAAQALLGKAYLYAENYGEAENWLGGVIESGYYQLVDDFETIINRNFDNDTESIFEVQFADIGASDVSSLREHYNLPQGKGGFGNHLPLESIVNAFEEGDPRLDYSVFIDGQPFAPSLEPDLHTYSSSWSATGYNLKKGLVPVGPNYNYTHGSANFPIIRYADVLLMYAEAANELDMPDEAREALNQVRQRQSVNMPIRTIAETNTKESMFEAIVQERRVELAFEYHRLNDLRRWGLAEEVLGPIGYDPSRHRYFPLPQSEIDTNPELVQIPGW